MDVYKNGLPTQFMKVFVHSHVDTEENEYILHPLLYFGRSVTIGRMDR